VKRASKAKPEKGSIFTQKNWRKRQKKITSQKQLDTT